MPLIPITKKCNQKCLFCSAVDRKDDISLKNILRKIDGVIRKGGRVITLSGGETTFSPHLFQIISYIKKRGLGIELQTNGVTLSYPGFTKKLVRVGVDLFNINVPSHRQDLNDKITQTHGYFIKRMAGIKNLEKFGAKIRLTHLIHSLNYKELPNFVEWVNRNFKSINFIQFSFIKIQGATEDNLWLVPRYEQVEPFLALALKKCKNHKIDFIVDHIPPCFLREFAEYHIDLIKIKIKANLELEKSLEEKQKIKACNACKLNKFCCGIRKDYLNLFGRRVKVKPILRNNFKLDGL